MEQGMTSMVPATGPAKKAKDSVISMAAVLLGVASVIMILQFVIVVVTIVLGNLTVKVNPETGEEINGIGKIFPDIARDWKSCLIFVIGIVCLCIARKAYKEANGSKKPKAKIVTMEEVEDTPSAEVGLDSTKEIDDDSESIKT